MTRLEIALAALEDIAHTAYQSPTSCAMTAFRALYDVRCTPTETDGVVRCEHCNCRIAPPFCCMDCQ